MFKAIKILTVLLLVLAILNGCKPADKEPTKPLSATELAQYQRLLEKYEPMLAEVEQYKQEAARIAEVEKNYVTESVELKNFSIFKTDSFDDGRARACYRGELINRGDEIIEQLELTVNFRNESKKQVIKTWKSNLIDANDEMLENDSMDLQVRAAVLTLSGKRLPLKPGASFDLQKNKNCMNDAFLGWTANATDYKISSVTLRPKLKEVQLYDVMNEEFYEMKLLEIRAKEFNQL
jgi:hypothetical protein